MNLYGLQFYQSIVRQMNQSPQNMRVGLAKNGNAIVVNNLNNLTIKQIEFANQNQELSNRPKTLKPVLPTKIYHHGYYKMQNKNKKMLPQLSIKQSNDNKVQMQQKNFCFKDRNFARPIKNTRNSQILNSLIQILKNDPDTSDFNKTRNGRIKTQPSFLNQFLESREISSVKNSRGPKIINSQIMKLGNQKGYKRNLVSEEKSRSRIFGDDGYSMNKQFVGKKTDAFDEMQMTFYRPSKNLLSQQQQNVQDKNLQQNQFINCK